MMADIANVRIFKWNKVEAKETTPTPSIEDYEGLFVFLIPKELNFTSTQGNPVISFKLVKLCENKTRDLALDMINKLHLFPGKTNNELLAKKLSDWIISSFRFDRQETLCQKLVFVVDVVAVTDGGAMSSLGSSGDINAYGRIQQREENNPYRVLEERREARARLRRINAASVHVVELIEKNQEALQLVEQQTRIMLRSPHVKDATSHMVKFLRRCTSNMLMQPDALEGLIDDVCSSTIHSIAGFVEVSDTITASIYTCMDELFKYLKRSELMINRIDEHKVKASLEEYHKALENIVEGFVSAFEKLYIVQQRIAPIIAHDCNEITRGTTDFIKANEDNYPEFSEVHSIIAKWSTSKSSCSEERPKKRVKLDLPSLSVVQKCLEKVPPSLEVIQSNDPKVCNDTELCSICLDKLPREGEMILNVVRCGHLFHRTCIFKWLSQHESCPNCRARNKVSVDV